MSASPERTLAVPLWRFDVGELLVRDPGTAALRRAGREAAQLVRRSVGPHAAISRSYAGAYMYVAAADAEAIGVDAERVRPLPRDGAGLSRLLSPPERAWLAALPEGEQLRAAHQLWTLKEAFGKAQGIGLHVLPWRLDFSAAMREAERVREPIDGLRFATFADEDGHTVGAIAARPTHPHQNHLVIRRRGVPAA